MDQKIIYGIIGVLSMIAGFGGSQVFDKDSLDHTYYCNVTDNIATFTRLSSTMKTGYYPDPNNATKELSKVCMGSQWIKLSDYAASKGVNPADLLIKQEIIKTNNNAPSEDCYPQDLNIGCIPRG